MDNKTKKQLVGTCESAYLRQVTFYKIVLYTPV